MIIKDKTKAEQYAAKRQVETGREHFVVPYQNAFMVTDHAQDVAGDVDGMVAMAAIMALARVR